MPRVVVVGAGPAGLICLRSLQKHCEGFEFVCYERRAQVGGEWQYMGDQEETYDKMGNPIRTTVYRELQMNTPTKVCTPHPEHEFPDSAHNYPTQQEMWQYFVTFAEKFQLNKYIHFGTQVTGIHFDKATAKYHMKVHQLNGDGVTDEVCDFVFMCIGQYNKPRIPDENLEGFTGERLHYHDMRDPKRMEGKRLLVMGSSWGAMDMVMMLNKPGRAKEMHVTWHNLPPVWGPSVPEVKMHSRPASASGNTVTFTDGSSAEVDTLIFCSGFTHAYPLCDELALDFEQSRFLFPVYKHLIHPKSPGIFFFGLANTAGLYMMRPQSEFACKVIKGELTLPSEQEMLADIAEFQAYWTDKLMKIMETNLREFFPITEIELASVNAVIKWADLQDLQPVGYFRPLFYQVLDGIIDDTMHYKSYETVWRDDPKKPGSKMPVLVPSTQA